MARQLLILARIAAHVSVFVAVSLESAVTLLLVLHNTVAAERLRAVLEAVVLTVQLIQHGI